MTSRIAPINATGGEADFAVADVGSLDEVRAAAHKAIGRYGRIDTWINNAGVAIYSALIDTPMDEHERLIRTNYFGAVHGALTAVEHLRENGGALITVGSIASDFPSPVMGAYSASKHAVKGYIESLRIELIAAKLPISVALIKPSGISTPIAQHAANHVVGEALIPPPVYDPDLVANAILDAAEHCRSDITVGGIGRLQALAANHFSGIYAHLGGIIAPLLSNPNDPKTGEHNLFRPFDDNIERSITEPGRTFSVSAPFGRHPAVFTGAALAIVAAVLTVFRLRKQSTR